MGGSWTYFWELWIQQGLGCRRSEKESKTCEPRIPTRVSQTPVRSYMFHTWVESLFAPREYTARTEMLCCGGGGNSWPEVVAAHFSRGYQWASPREAGDITYTLAGADTMLRRQTTDPHPDCDASCYPSFGKERVWGRNRGKYRKSIWVNRFPQGILILPREACDMNWFYLHTHFIIWMLKVFIRVLYITKLQVLTCLMRNRQMAV